MIEVDTTNILFIAGGAFVGLDQIIARRLDGTGIGFGARVERSESVDDYLAQVTPDDLMKYGMIPEFTGRFTTRVGITELTRDELLHILTGIKNSYIDQYTYLLSLDNIELEFDQQALDLIADNCLKMKTGARALHSEIERILLPHMYNVQVYIKNNIKRINITKELVETPMSLVEGTE
jgi:ATP-dependent Clp protease ATP-binding subunit ClpX